jgi:hypothetical protein
MKNSATCDGAQHMQWCIKPAAQPPSKPASHPVAHVLLPMVFSSQAATRSSLFAITVPGLLGTQRGSISK